MFCKEAPYKVRELLAQQLSNPLLPFSIDSFLFTSHFYITIHFPLPSVFSNPFISPVRHPFFANFSSSSSCFLLRPQSYQSSMRLNISEHLNDESASCSDFLEYCADQQVSIMQTNNNTTRDNYIDLVFHSLYEEVRKKNRSSNPQNLQPQYLSLFKQYNIYP